MSGTSQGQSGGVSISGAQWEATSSAATRSQALSARLAQLAEEWQRAGREAAVRALAHGGWAARRGEHRGERFRYADPVGIAGPVTQFVLDKLRGK